MSERIPLMGSKEGKGVMYSGHNEETSHLYPLSSAPIEVEKEDHIQSSESDQEPEDTYINSLNAKEKQEEIREGIRTGSLFLIGILAVGVMLVYLQFILIPLVFSRFLVYIFQPLVNLFIGKKPWPFIGVRTHLPRLLAVSIVLLLIVALLAALGVIIFISVKQVLNHSDSYLEQLNKWEQLIVDWAKRWGYTEEELKNMLPEIDWSGYVVKLLGFFADLIPQMFLIVLFVVYMLLDFDATKQKTELRHSIDEKIRRYILVHSLVALGMGVGTWVILEAMSINLALFFGLMAFILEYIPNIGSVVAVLLPMPLVVLDPEVSWIIMLLTFFLPALLHFLLGQVLEPRILGHVMEIPALTVLVCLMFWGSVWGIIGAVLSVPLTVAVKLYLETIDHPMPRFLATIITNLGCD